MRYREWHLDYDSDKEEEVGEEEEEGRRKSRVRGMQEKIEERKTEKE